MSTKPKTYQGDIAHLPPALEGLTRQDSWVVWSWERRVSKSGKETWTKPPRNARDPSQLAKSNDPKTWATYPCAVAAVDAHQADGIGFALRGSRVGAIDLDAVRNPETGSIVRWAQQIVEEANGAYTETTVSGKGLRIIGEAQGPELQRRFNFNRKTGAGIELYRETNRYITVSGLELGHCTKLPPFDDFLDRMVARFSSADFDFDFNKDERDYDDIIQNGAPEGTRSELFQKVVWHLAHKGSTLEQIVEELGRYPNGIAAKYRDRLQAEAARSYEKWRRRTYTSAAGKPLTSKTPWPQIIVRAGELPAAINAAEDALIADPGCEMYQHGDLIVRPALLEYHLSRREPPDWRLITVVPIHLVDVLTGIARFLRYDKRAKGFVPIDAPTKVAEGFLKRIGQWRLRKLSSIVTTPFLRPDGSICDRPGYDSATGVLYKPDPATNFPPIPPEPSRADATAARDELKQLIKDFPFVAGADMSVALSAILTALDRHAMPTAPLHAFSSPVPGTGKSLLVDVVALLATGRPMPVIAQGRTEEELEKRLGAALLAGDIVISIDNCAHPLESTFLCQVLTQQQVSVRILGQSRNVRIPVASTIFATGNNLSIVGDLGRRVLVSSLDAGCERPEERRFETDVAETARSHRGRLVVAALTVLRAWHVTTDRVELQTFGGFEDWSHRIRKPLVWLGEADPCITLSQARSSDAERDALEAVLTQWELHLGTQSGFTLQEVIAQAMKDQDFYTALRSVAESRGAAGIVSNDRLGRWLKTNEGKIVNGLKLKKVGRSRGYPIWKLTS
jgi:hypothetical protein